MRNGFGAAAIAALWLGLATPAAGQAAWPVSGELTDSDSQAEEARRYDDYPLRLDGGQRYRISVDSDAFDPLARLYREGQAEPVAENDDGEGLNSLIIYTPPQSGEYRLRVTSFSSQGRGAYTANVVQQAPLPPAVSSPWSGAGSIADGEGDGTTSYDEIPVRLEAGQRYRLAVDSAAFDPVASLYAPSGGDPVAVNDDAEGGLNARIFYRPRESGIYVLRVAALQSSGRGAYTVQIGPTPPLPAPSTYFSSMEATIWRVYTGAIAPTDPTDNEGRKFDDYLVTFAAGQRRMISLESSAFDAYLRIYRADDREGEPVATDDDSGGELNSLLIFTAADAGDYVVRVSGLGGNAAGDYRLRVSER